MSDNKYGWEEWGRHVLTTLEKLETKVDQLEDRINSDKIENVTEIVSLKAKAGLWGSVAGIIASIITSITVGVIIYSLTVGTEKQSNTATTDIPKVGIILPARDNESIYRNDDDDVTGA